MATVTTETVKEPDTVTREPARPEPYRMTVEVYDRIVDAGVFGDKSPFYLWKGQLVLPMPKGPRHGFSLTTLNRLLIRLVPDGWHVRQETPTRLGDDSEPEPDLTVVRGSARDYLPRHPSDQDVSLAVEVADSSRTFDSGEKKERYAAAGIPIYWVVNLPQARIDVYTGPSGPADAPNFSEQRRFGPGEEVPVILDGREVGRIAVNDVLP